MKINYKFLIVSLMMGLLCMAGSALADGNKSPQEQYISMYSRLAVEEMYRSGVPASITLAQGLLESRYGLSELAVKGNNHFGIKCHNAWQGGKMYHDDDMAGECFRMYRSPEESFRDHSDFLRYRDRYKFLFDLEVTDYKGWAHGLRKAGYATDPAYPSKLIRLIEEYSLFEYDKAPARGDRHLYKGTPKTEQVQETTQPVRENKTPRQIKREQRQARKEQVKAEKAAEKAERSTLADGTEVCVPETIPESPSKIEAIQLIEPDGEFSFSLSRQMYSLNGVPFVYSAHGETYASIAKVFKLFPKEILRLNDLSSRTDLNAPLIPGTLIYVQPKKNEAARGLDKHVIEDGDNMRELSQRYGVKLDRIYRMNGLDRTYVPCEGDIIKLRK